jgi:hypothetical protein
LGKGEAIDPRADAALRARTEFPNPTGEDLVEVAATEDPQPVEAFAADCPDPALGVRYLRSLL